MVNKYLIILCFIWCFILTGCITGKHTIDPQIKDYICTDEYDVKHDWRNPFTVDSEGNFYITYYINDPLMNIKKYNSQGKYITGWVPEIKKRKKNCWFSERAYPSGVEQLSDIFADKENIYLAYSTAHGYNSDGGYSTDYTGHIEQFDLNGKFITAIKPEKDSFPRDFVRFITKDKKGNFYLASLGHIEKYDSNWKLQSVLYPFKKKWYIRTDLSDRDYIFDLVVDSKENIYNLTQGHVDKFDHHGNFIKEWIPSRIKGKFSKVGLEIDSDDNMYMLGIDEKNYCILKFDSSGNLITEWNFEGKEIVPDIIISSATIKINSAGNVYVDTGKGTIKKFSPKQ
jgi:hypothetical protein